MQKDLWKIQSKEKQRGSYYLEGCKHCPACQLFINWKGVVCPCCHVKLRTKPRNLWRFHFPRITYHSSHNYVKSSIIDRDRNAGYMKIPLLAKKEKQFTCKECKMVFQSKESLERHKNKAKHFTGCIYLEKPIGSTRFWSNERKS
jgi:uncharacterized paraquat-inducible protein A